MSSARVWNYWLGGGEHYAADRAAAEEFIRRCPQIVSIARETRRFQVRAVRHLAGPAGVRQFLDIGAGMPFNEHTHEVAQSVASDARVVYVDNDPLVVAHAMAWRCSATRRRGPRTRATSSFVACFDRLELLEPGAVPVNEWRPEEPRPGHWQPAPDTEH
jgi:hypothetical protein